MGQFSWLDCVTGEQVIDGLNRKSYVLVPRAFGGGHIEEDCYEGYGVFGGHDVYDLVLDWNKDDIPRILGMTDEWVCNIDEENLRRFHEGREITCEKRRLGIDLACYDDDNARLRYPIKITHDPDVVYEWCAPSYSDPNQGWAVEGDDDWDDDWDDEEW